MSNQSSETRRRYLALILLPLCFVLLGLVSGDGIDAPVAASRRSNRAQSGVPTFSQEIVRIFQKNCQTCHHVGDIAPFSLMTFADARPWSRSIREQVILHKMPPWKPTAGCGDFRETRGLTDDERAKIVAWVDGASPEGNPADLPVPLEFPDGWPLGEPDLVLSMNEDYTPPTGGDIYRCFSLPVGLRGDRYVSAVDVRPGNRKIVHHMIGYLDPNGASVALDAADPGQGYTCFGGPGFSATGILNAWAPGARAIDEGDGIGIKLPKNARVVLQLHYHPSYPAEKDRTQIGLYFARSPVKKELNFLPLENKTFSIPAGAKRHEVTESVTIPALSVYDSHIVSIAPHMHLLGREIGVDITRPSSQPECLVKIEDWDFNWQTFYHFKQPIAAPGGSRLKLTSYYDNSSDNPRNPNLPPKLVKYGEQTTDEMCLGIVGFTSDIQVLPLSSPQLTSVSVDAQGNLVVTGTGILAGAEIEIGGRVVRDTRVNGATSTPLLSGEYWKVLSPPGQQVSVTILNPDGVRSSAQLFMRTGTASVLATVSAANYSAPASPESIAAAFGTDLAGATLIAATIPLPTELGGTQVRVNGELAPLFFVASGQINFLIPGSTVTGTAVVEVTRAGGLVSRGELVIASTSPSLFTANSSGSGAPAALATVDGITYRQIGNADGTANEIFPAEFLVLFGTGIRKAATGTVKITIGGKNAPVFFAGAQDGFVGLDQVNTQIPTGVSGTVTLSLFINNQLANTVIVKVG
ncbi:MAG: hypothetical protein ABI882_04230 [Acidobacteriota bacterium]